MGDKTRSRGTPLPLAIIRQPAANFIRNHFDIRSHVRLCYFHNQSADRPTLHRRQGFYIDEAGEGGNRFSLLVRILDLYSRSQDPGVPKVLEFAKASRSGGKMIGRTVALAVMACVLLCMSLGSAGAQVPSRKSTVHQSDITLFEQAQKALNRSSFAEARGLLRNLIDTYPDSDYVPRAKLSIADSWFSEHEFRQAELEYQDFITFFPNRLEVAEAQRRINSIHKNSSF